MSSPSLRFGIPRALGKYVAVVALVASGLTLGIAGSASATPTITEASGFPTSVESPGVTSIAFNPQHVGDIVILTSQIHSQSTQVSSVSATGTGTWQLAERYKDTTNGLITEEVWWAVATATGATTANVTYSASVSGISPELVVDSYTTSQASSWTAITGGGAAATAVTTIAYPSLTSGAATGGAAQLYFGYAESTSTAVAGSTPGFTYTSTNDGSGNLTVDDPALAATTDYAPTASQIVDNTTSIAAIFAATAIDTVTFNSEGGSAVGNLSGPNGSTITLPAAPTLAGNTFEGWFAAASGGTALTSPYTLTGSVTLYAQWLNNSTITFNSEGGSNVSNITAATGAAITLPAAPTFAGYTFNGWFLASSGGTALTSPYTVASSTTLYAQWTANATDTIQFNSEGGTSVANATGPNGSAITLPAAPTFAGYTFNGWFLASSGGTALTSPYTLTGSLTLYAQWTANVTDTIQFNSEGGTSVANATGPNGSAITLPAAPTFAGYTFNGWFLASSGGTALTSPYTLTGSLTLYAQWTANATDTVAFNSQGGSAVGSLSGLNGTTITLPAAPTRAGFTFNGWFAAASGGTALTSPYTLTGSTTLYAQWTANAGTYTVTFNNNGGQGSLTSESGSAPAALSLFQTGNMTQTNSYFTGWNTAANGSGTAYGDGATYPFNASVTLYAQWTLVNEGSSLLPLGITASSGTIAFGGSFTPSASVTAGLTAGDTAALSGTVFTYAGTGGTTYAASTTAPTAVGTYSVTPSGATVTVTPAADQNKYSTHYAYVAGTLTITAPVLTVTAGSVTVQVGGTVTPSASVSGLGGTDTATVSAVTYTYTGTGSTSYPASTTAPTAVGTYSITPSAATVAVSPTADAPNYGSAYSYVSGTLTITAKPKPPVVLHAKSIVGAIRPGHRVKVTIVGTGFSGRPKITSSSHGTTVVVSGDTGTHLTVWVTVPASTKAGRATLTIRLANGKTTKINYVIK